MFSWQALRVVTTGFKDRADCRLRGQRAYDVQVCGYRRHGPMNEARPVVEFLVGFGVDGAYFRPS